MCGCACVCAGVCVSACVCACVCVRAHGNVPECRWWCPWKWSLRVVMSRLGAERKSIAAIKRPGGSSLVADSFPPAKTDPVCVRGCVCQWVCTWDWESVHVSVCVCARMCVCVCVCVCACVLLGADDRGRGLCTQGTTNEREAFPLTFHGSQKQFAQRKVAKQPPCHTWQSWRGKQKP